MKKVGSADEVPKETYSQFTNHEQKTQLNKIKGQSEIENILKCYALLYIIRS